jgi:hypothetical protein
MDTSGAELYSVSGEPYEDEPGGLQLVPRQATFARLMIRRSFGSWVWRLRQAM